MTHDGRGLARVDGKAVFVAGALEDERVRLKYTRRQRHHDEAVTVEVLDPAPSRVEPFCPHFGVCGGCSLQHMATDAQVAMKQNTLRDVLQRIGHVEPEVWLPPLRAAHAGYRRKARLGVRYVPKKGKTLVGFRERGNSFVADLITCDVLHPVVGHHLTDIAALVDGLSIRDKVPQIEVAIGDAACVLVFRVLAAPSAVDLERLDAFGRTLGVHVYLQDAGVDSVRALPGHEASLHYTLPNPGVELSFEPVDFTQINHELNQQMVDQAIDLLALKETDQVLDLFCGIGNFTLPIARRAGEVVGVEGSDDLVVRARANAERNDLSNVELYSADLYGTLGDAPWNRRTYNKALLDPPRSGALAILDRLPRMEVERIVYVSCYPATLARDADQLVNTLGYRLQAAGAMDMFPHTTHIESIALFTRNA